MFNAKKNNVITDLIGHLLHILATITLYTLTDVIPPSDVTKPSDVITERFNSVKDVRLRMYFRLCLLVWTIIHSKLMPLTVSGIVNLHTIL